MTLTLTSNTEAKLLALAERRGQAPEEIIEALVQREMDGDGAALEKPTFF